MRWHHESAVLCLLAVVVFAAAGSSDSPQQQQQQWQTRPCASLHVGQYKCDKPVIDDAKQTAVNCTSDDTVAVACYPASNVICDGRRFDGRTVGFHKRVFCRYVSTYHYQTATLLSIFFGIVGADRFYLGYNAIGCVKLCTFGLMFIGYLFDMCMIITQTLRPADNSHYIVDYYGQVLFPSIAYNNYTFNFTLN